MIESIIRRFGRIIDHTRLAAGSYVDGYYETGTATTNCITAAVQPLTAKEQALLPEGDRQKGWVKVYTTVPIITGDFFLIDGINYEVLKVWDWTANATGRTLRHYKAEAVVVNEVTPRSYPAEAP